MRFFVGVLTGLLLAILAPVVLLVGGFIDMGAADGQGVPEIVLSDWAVDRWVHVSTPPEQEPLEGDEAAWTAGLELYEGSCLACHGAPEVDPAAWAQAMVPRPPDLSHSNDRLTETQIAHITREGVRLSGMPAYGGIHSDAEIRQIARFVRDMERLDRSQRQRLERSLSNEPGIRLKAGRDAEVQQEARGVRGNDPPRFPRTDHAPK